MRIQFGNFNGTSLKAELLRGVTGTAGLKLISTLLTLLSGVLLARLLGPESYGLYVFVISLVTLIGIPTQGGLPTLVMRETAKYRHDSEWKKLRGLLLSSNIFVAIISIVSAVSVFLYVVLFLGDSDRSNAIMWSLALLPFTALANVRGAILKGFKKVVQGGIPDQLIRPLVVVALLAAAFFMKWEITAINAIQYTVIGALVAFVFGTFLIIRVLPSSLNQANPEFHLKSWLASVVPLTLFSSLNIANNQAGMTILGVLGLDEDNGFYRVAFQGATLLSMAMLIVEGVIAPFIVSLTKENKKSDLQKVLTKGALFSFVVSFPLAIIFLFWGKYFIILLFGEEYASAHNVLIVLTLGQMVRVVFGSAGLVLNMLGKEVYVAFSAFIAILSNVIICIYLAPSYGAIGVAIASTISICIWSGVLALFAYVFLKIDTTILGAFKSA